MSHDRKYVKLTKIVACTCIQSSVQCNHFLKVLLHKILIIFMQIQYYIMYNYVIIFKCITANLNYTMVSTVTRNSILSYHIQIHHVDQGSYRREKLEFLPLDFRPILFQHATISQLQAFQAPKANLRQPIFITFPGRAKCSVLHMMDTFPFLTKNSCMRPC